MLGCFFCGTNNSSLTYGNSQTYLSMMETCEKIELIGCGRKWQMKRENDLYYSDDPVEYRTTLVWILRLMLILIVCLQKTSCALSKWWYSQHFCTWFMEHAGVGCCSYRANISLTMYSEKQINHKCKVSKIEQPLFVLIMWYWKVSSFYISWKALQKHNTALKIMWLWVLCVCKVVKHFYWVRSHFIPSVILLLEKS